MRAQPHLIVEDRVKFMPVIGHLGITLIYGEDFGAALGKSGEAGEGERSAKVSSVPGAEKTRPQSSPKAECVVAANVSGDVGNFAAVLPQAERGLCPSTIEGARHFDVRLTVPAMVFVGGVSGSEAQLV